MRDEMFTKGTTIYSRDGKMKGVATGGQRRCQLHGCTGMRIAVRWPDGKLTYPCSKGIAKRKRWQIG